MIRWILIAWVLLECATYVLFLSHFSILAALGVGLGSTLLGVLAVKAAGRRLVTLAAGELHSGALKLSWNSETFLIGGALLLLLPGFLSDAAGLVLLALSALPSRRNVRSPGPADIDLTQGEWRRLPDEPPR